MKNNDFQAHTSCPLCKSNACTKILSLSNLPVHSHQLFKSAEAALKVKKGQINLAYCNDCTHIFNQSFDPSLIDYSESYENALHYSPVFRKYEETLAQYLISKYNLKDKKVVDLGAGDGHFLQTICDIGHNKGLAIDSSVVTIDESPGNIEFLNSSIFDVDFEEKIDLITCRHVLEHIYDVDEFLKILSAKLKKTNEDIPLYFEVPNADYMIDNQSYFDILYEHVHYFTAHSLESLFSNNGFYVEAIYPGYGGQFLCLEAFLENDQSPKKSAINTDIKDKAETIFSFNDNFKSTIEKYKKSVLQLMDSDNRMVIWGAGSKGITLLNILNIPNIKYVVDINPRKHQHFISGTNVQIVPPEFLISYKPNTVIITNLLYREEIKQLLQKMQLSAQIIGF